MDEPGTPAAPVGTLFPGGLFAEFQVTDFDELATAADGWDQRLLKLRREPFSGGLRVVQTGHLQVATERWSCGMLATGSVPRGIRSFALIVGQSHPTSSFGYPVRSDQLATSSDLGEFHFVTRGPSEHLVLSLTHDLLEQASATMLGMEWREAIGTAPVLKLRGGAASAGALRNIERTLRQEAACLSNPAASTALEQDAACTFMAALAVPPVRVAPRERHRIAKRVSDYLRANQTRRVTIAELCTAVGAPERTLHKACREYFGLPPIAYLRLLRLHGARRDLRQLGSSITVTEVATRWGFFHFGEFAAAYRRQFGERPSETAKGFLALSSGGSYDARRDRPDCSKRGLGRLYQRRD